MAMHTSTIGAAHNLPRESVPENPPGNPGNRCQRLIGPAISNRAPLGICVRGLVGACWSGIGAGIGPSFGVKQANH